ncbi:uncharacterized protein LOC100891625 [Strongylocentrotus purpuratus]|uniref:Uncharacterized protein n=1 Tax=Strongylocentrotus purpuratus TaxID=7668 RepID=A0A7M7GH96_STRPU|nr:uncharacterized protein LOC100891625 [Strongylocentrotus purpuratus]
MILKCAVISVLLLGTCLLQCSSMSAVWDVRLRGGPETSYMREGRVEIFLGNKGWFGTCDKEWGIEEAIVVCRQLGYPGAIHGTPSYSSSVGTVLLSREWRCTGDEASLVGCNNYHPTFPCYEHTGVKCHGPGYLGCYQDTYGALTSTLIDNVIVEPDMTEDRCWQFCMYRHYRIYGLKNGNECYCGLVEAELANHTKLSDAECQAPCPGDYGQVCGGYRTDIDKLSVFDVNMGECYDPGAPANGIQLDTSFKFGDIVRFACLPGYELLGIEAIQCILAPGGPGMGVIWSTSVPYCAVMKLTSPPVPTQEPTTTRTTTTPSTTMRVTTTTMKTTTTSEPVQTTTTSTTEKRTTREATTAESSKVMSTEKRTTTVEVRVPVDTTSTTMTPSDKPSSSTPETLTKAMTSSRRSTQEMASEASKKPTTMEVEKGVNDVTNYTDYITKPTTTPGNNTSNNAAATKPFNFFTMISEHSILIALVGTFLILLVPIIIIVIFKRACRRKNSPSKVQIERTMDYQLGSETTGFTYEPQPMSRPRYQSFRRGFKRFSKRPWSDREEDESSDDEL